MGKSEDGVASFQDLDDWLNLGAALGCVSCAALAAGLTMGLLSLDKLKLKIKTMTGNEEERKHARAILPLLSDHHFLLCTLLIFNATANEALPIFLDELLPSWGAIVVSVTLVLVFGEVVPTALFTGPQQLKIASDFSGVVGGLQLMFYPLARPMATALDYFLGHDSDKDETYTRDEIAAMVRILRSKGAGVQEIDPADAMSPKSESVGEEVVHPLHKLESEVITKIDGMHKRRLDSTSVSEGNADEEGRDSEESEEAPLTVGEVNVITGVLGLAKLTIADVLVPIEKVNMLSTDQIFDIPCVNAISKVGHSRLPVFKGKDMTHIVGVFVVKRLVTINPERKTPLSELKTRKPLVVGTSQSLLDVLSIFQQGSSHIAIVSNDAPALMQSMLTDKPPAADCAPVGIVTIEDIFEAMIQSQILDEADMDANAREEGTLDLRDMSMNAITRTSSFTSAIEAAADMPTTGALQGKPGGAKDPTFIPPWRRDPSQSSNEKSTGSNVRRGSLQNKANAAAEAASKSATTEKLTTSNPPLLASDVLAKADELQQAKPTLLRALSNPLKRAFSGKATKTTKLLPDDKVVDDYKSFENRPRSMSDISESSRKSPSPYASRSPTLNGDMEAGNKDDSSLEKRSFYRKYDHVFNEFGVPLMEEPTSPRRRATTVSSANGQPPLTKESLSTLKPSMVAKYVKTRRYSIGEAGKN